MVTRVLPALAGSLLAACFDPSLEGVRCSPGGDCPPGLTCVADTCISSDNQTIDAATSIDGAMVADASVIDAAVADATDPSQSRFVKAITVDASNVGQALQDFPVYIAITGDDDLRLHASAGGDDVYFTDATGAVGLDHEVQRWDRDAGRLEAWVRVPTLSAGSDTVLELRYGDPGIARAENPPGVWSNGFVAVWHLEQTPGAGAIVDSLGDYPGTTSGGMTSDDLVAAPLGSGIELDGNDDVITFSNPLLGASPHTISAWVDQQVSADNEALVVLGNGACGQARFLHSRFTGGTVAVGFYCDDVTTDTDIQDAGWTLLHWTYDSADSRLYVAGAQAEVATHAGTQDTQGTAGRIGNASTAFGANVGLNGAVDEVRIANVARSAAWIATEHANQASPDTFYTVGPEQSVPSP